MPLNYLFIFATFIMMLILGYFQQAHAQEQRSCSEIATEYKAARHVLITSREWQQRSEKILEAVRYLAELSGAGADKLDSIKKSLEDGNISKAQEALKSISEGAGNTLETMMDTGDEFKGKLSETKKLIETGDKILTLALAADGQGSEDPAELARNFKSYFGLLTGGIPGGISGIDEMIDDTELRKEWENFKKKPSKETFEKVSEKAAEKSGQIAETFKAATSSTFVIGAFIEAYGIAVDSAMDTFIGISALRQKQQSLLDQYFPELGGKTMLFLPGKKTESALDRVRKKMAALKKEFDEIPCEGDINDSDKELEYAACSIPAMVKSAEITDELCRRNAPNVDLELYKAIHEIENSILRVRRIEKRYPRIDWDLIQDHLTNQEKEELRELIAQRQAKKKIADARDDQIKACWAKARSYNFSGTLRNADGKYLSGKSMVQPNDSLSLEFSMCHLWDSSEEIFYRPGIHRTPWIAIASHNRWPVNWEDRGWVQSRGALYQKSGLKYSGRRNLKAPDKSGNYHIIVIDNQFRKSEDTFLVASYEVFVAHPLNGLWKMGNTIIEIKQDGNKVTGVYHRFLAGSKYEKRGRKIGEEALRGTLNSASFIGTRWDSFESKYKELCGSRWSQWTEIDLQYNGEDTLTGNWARQFAEIHSCRLKEKRIEALKLTRYQP